ncbi:hypothetical protein [Gemmatimonas sp.]|uniref:hypothetical protein n=1 Tax=Gemmatimonas sp. TaxID=1962908 RepID=UPI00286CDAD3|nr:hypothetical protein [Gemmatimonas sp.]
MTLSLHLRRAGLSLLLWALPLALFPPWIHVEPIDQAFWTHRYGDFDRHAPFWQPPFYAEVAANSALKLPVVVDLSRLFRELLVAAAVTYWLLDLVGQSRPRGPATHSPRRIYLLKLAALTALLLPIPPAGVLAFSSWESLTDWNHGIPFLLPMLIYWGLLTGLTYLAFLLALALMKVLRPAQNAP